MPPAITFGETDLTSCKWPDAKTIPHVRNRITVVRIAVVRFESTSLIPILAQMAAKAANRADNKADIFPILVTVQC